MKFKHGSTLMGMATLLAGCLGGLSSIYQDDRAENYDPAMVQYDASDGVIAGEVFGSPFGAGRQEDILSNIHIPGHFSPAGLAPQKGASTRMIFVFGPPVSLQSRHICQGKIPADLAGGAERMTVQAVYCLEERVYSEAILSMPRPASAEAEAFRREMALLMQTVLPIRPKSDAGRGCEVGC